MAKKRTIKRIKKATKMATIMVVGCGTSYVTSNICAAYAPAASAHIATRAAHAIGTYGFSGVTGAIAADMTLQEIGLFKRFLTAEDKKPKETKKEEATA